MGFLAKISKVPNWAAVLTIFLAWYIAASLTTLFVTGMYQQILTSTGIVFACVLVFMFIAFVIAWRINRTDLVDLAWGPAFIVAAVASFLLNSYDVGLGFNLQTVVTLLVVIWGLRLTISISKRFRGHPEDKRYVELKQKWKGNQAWNMFTRIFLVQAILATIISLAVIHINLSLETPFSVFTYVGLVIWLIGFMFETIGDRQLRYFLADPINKGKLMMTGLWKYTRHPNYFGEATMWWGIFVMALGTEYGWVASITPVVITFLLLFVSGVPLAEKAFESKPGWAWYERHTSKFFPLPQNRD